MAGIKSIFNKLEPLMTKLVRFVRFYSILTNMKFRSIKSHASFDNEICIGNSMISSDIWHEYHE